VLFRTAGMAEPVFARAAPGRVRTGHCWFSSPVRDRATSSSWRMRRVSIRSWRSRPT